MDIVAPVTDYIAGSVLTTQGDLVKHDGSDAARLPVGTANQALQVNAAGDDLEFVNRGNLLTTRGDLIKHNGTVAARFPMDTGGKILRIKGDPLDLVYEHAGEFLFEEEDSAENAGIITILATSTSIAYLNLGDVLLNGRYSVSLYACVSKDGTPGEVRISVTRFAGTATIEFLKDFTSLDIYHDLTANEMRTTVFSTVMKITGSGPLTLHLYGQSTNGEATVPLGFGQIYAHRMKVS